MRTLTIADNWKDWKFGDTDAVMTFTALDDDKVPDFSNRTLTFKIASTLNNDLEHPKDFAATATGYIQDKNVILKTEDVKQLTPGNYIVELWAMSNDTQKDAVYPSKGFAQFTIEENSMKVSDVTNIPSMTINAFWNAVMQKVGTLTKGAKGDPGQTPKIVMGSVTKLSPDAQPSATLVPLQSDPNTYTLNLQLPQGVQGEQGLQGIPGVGSKGLDGNNGLTPTIDPKTKHWMIGGTDTGVIAEGQAGKDADPSKYVTIVSFNQLHQQVQDNATTLTMALQNKLAQINVNPEFFTDLNALSAKYPNGKEGVFILDNGHTAIYQNGWQDSGHSITVGSFVYRAFIEITDVTAPYDSLDTLPSNSIIFYAPDVTQKFFELPFTENHVSIAVITLGADFSSQTNYGRVQRLINRDTGNEYYRNVWVGSDGKMRWNDWFSQSGMQQLAFTGEPLSSPYDDLNTLPNNTVVSYAPLKSLKNNPLNEAIIVKTEGPNIVTNKDYTKIQTLIGQWSGKKYYRTVWIGDNGTGNWTDWHSSEGMQQLAFTGEPLSSPYDDLNTLPYNKLVFYAPLKSLKNNPVSEPIIVKTEGPNIPTSKNYGEIQTLIGQWSYKEYHRIRWVGDDGTGNWGDWHSESVTQEANKTDLNEVSLSIFDKVAVIGDSYSAGWLLKPDGSSFYDKSKYQWPRLLGKKYGFAVNNLSMSGWTAQDFVNSKLNDIAVAGPQDAYIIALGINDQSNGKETLGSKDDLKEDYQSNPDSFYGNMGKIIGTIKANDINARIILLTIMRNDGAVTTTFDSAIKEIAGHYGLPVADITSDPYFQTDTYNQRKAGGHPTIVGYGALAEHLDNVLQKTILNNYDYFCNTASIFDTTI